MTFILDELRKAVMRIDKEDRLEIVSEKQLLLSYSLSHWNPEKPKQTFTPFDAEIGRSVYIYARALYSLVERAAFQKSAKFNLPSHSARFCS